MSISAVIARYVLQPACRLLPHTRASVTHTLAAHALVWRSFSGLPPKPHRTGVMPVAGAERPSLGVRQVLFNVPNCVGYVRLLLLATATTCMLHAPEVAFYLFIGNFTLDAVDGYLARRLNQCSSYGAFLDVLIDVASRGFLWCAALPPPWGALPLVLEATAFTCTHKGGGAAWKDGYFSGAPWWVRGVMRNGLRNPAGAVVVAGLMGAPLWCWAHSALSGTWCASPALGALLLPARALAAAVEVWVVLRHLRGLLQDDVRARPHDQPANTFESNAEQNGQKSS